jgi:hypothetical protein
MSATLIPDMLTPLSVEEMLSALADGYSLVMGDDPSAKCLAVLGAQVCLETGNMLHVHRHNWGNVKCSADWNGFYCMFRCNEVIGGKVRWFDPPHPQTHFRAFLEAYEGAREYVRFLALRPRYRAAWSRAFHGDPDRFVLELGRAGYFTANPDTYARAVVSIAGHIRPACERILGTPDGGLSDEDRDHVSQLVAVTLWDSARGGYDHGEDRLAA